MSSFRLFESGLSSEFLRLGAGETTQERLQSGLIKANILRSGETLVGMEDRNAWHQGGAQTFVADGIIELERSHRESRHVIAKALFSFASPADLVLRTWLRRRETLKELGIEVPVLYSSIDGTIYEEFIESELDETSLSEEIILRELSRIAAVLDRAGFAALDFIRDLRRRNNQLYYVDFGFDLGEPGETSSNTACATLQRRLPRPSLERCLQHYYKVFESSKGIDLTS